MAHAPVKLPIDDAVAGLVNGALHLDGFFPEFNTQHLEKLFPRSGLYSYPREFHLIAQGSLDRDLYLIYSGRVAISQTMGSAAAALAELGRGEMFGEMALLGKGPRKADVRVIEDSKIYHLFHQDLDYVLKHNAQLAAHLRHLAETRLKGR